MLGVLYALGAAACWGTGDFNGGLATRRSGVYGVVIAVEVIGAVLLLGLGLAFAEALPGGADIVWSLLAGIAGGVGLALLYQALATGQMGVAAPVTAVVSGVVPITVALLTDGIPTPLRLIGFAVALGAVWLISGGSALRASLGALRLPILAGVGFGFYLVFVDRIESGLFYPLTIARLSALVLLVVVALIRRQPLAPKRESLPFVGLSGLFDAGGNVFFLLATQTVRLDVAAVLSSLYPAVTVLLAWLILREQLTARQWSGVAAALVAIVLISA